MSSAPTRRRNLERRALAGAGGRPARRAGAARRNDARGLSRREFPRRSDVRAAAGFASPALERDCEHDARDRASRCAVDFPHRPCRFDADRAAAGRAGGRPVGARAKSASRPDIFPAGREGSVRSGACGRCPRERSRRIRRRCSKRRASSARSRRSLYRRMGEHCSSTPRRVRTLPAFSRARIRGWSLLGWPPHEPSDWHRAAWTCLLHETRPTSRLPPGPAR